MKESQHFRSRLGMMLVMLGMAVGTGNIWRFPRIAAQNGGGEFLVPWIVFLLLWSIPLLLVEFGMGRMLRAGPVRAFALLLGPGWAWMGAFIAFVATAILFYYSVVTGWTFRFGWAAIIGELPERQPGQLWAHYTASWWPVLTHGLAIGVGTLVVARGIRFIETVARILMPILIALVVILALRAVTLPGSEQGLTYLFHVDWGHLVRARLWLAALTQNAWDTGAGWGLALCYAAYLRESDDTALNAIVLPVANNVVSLLAGVTVICTVFSVVPRLAAEAASSAQSLARYPELAAAVSRGARITPEVVQRTIFASGNEGLTFVWIPQLMGGLPGGRALTALFFVALALAAMTSLIAMVELATRVLVDAGVRRASAVWIVGTTAFLLGLPSAISLHFLKNQDWVWGVALMLSGLFFSIAVISHGVRRFRLLQLNHAHSDVRIGAWWDLVIGILVPLEAVTLLVWWLAQARSWAPGAWLTPFAQENVGTVLVQLACVLVVLVLSSRWLARRSLAGAEND